MTPRIQRLKTAVETMHKCKADHLASVPVREIFQGKVAWEGVVDSFALHDHPKAKKCYAWSYLERDEHRYVAVLEIPPVDSAQTAVKVAVASNLKN